jgi:hypothetical protein
MVINFVICRIAINRTRWKAQDINPNMMSPTCIAEGQVQRTFNSILSRSVAKLFMLPLYDRLLVLLLYDMLLVPLLYDTLLVLLLYDKLLVLLLTERKE